MKNPETNLLKAIVISLIAITGFYLLINFMYISILGVENILASPAVATSYAQKIFPQIRCRKKISSFETNHLASSSL